MGSSKLPNLFILVIWGAAHYVYGLFLDVEDSDSIRNASRAVAYGLQSMYKGNQTGGVVGKFPYPPFYWWLSGAVWGGMMNYWQATGDESWYNVTYDALVAQISPTYNFMPAAEALDEGNDDVAFWAFAAMTAAEFSYREPPSPYPSWLQICDNVFNDYIRRWYNASKTCGGGLKWQIFPSSPGYDYKNSISVGGFFQLAARLYRFTANETYYIWAIQAWDWEVTTKLIDDDFNVFDGTDDTINCTGIDHTLWSYNVAIFLYGAAILHNTTGEPWGIITDGLLNATAKFTSPFPNATNIMYEQECEPSWKCNVDQYSFKAYLARWLAGTSMMKPDTAGKIAEVLKASAEGAAASCSEAEKGGYVMCGARWYLGQGDGTIGVGQSLSALEVMYALLVNETKPPMTLKEIEGTK